MIQITDPVSKYSSLKQRKKLFPPIFVLQIVCWRLDFVAMEMEVSPQHVPSSPGTLVNYLGARRKSISRTHSASPAQAAASAAMLQVQILFLHSAELKATLLEIALSCLDVGAPLFHPHDFLPCGWEKNEKPSQSLRAAKSLASL